MRHGNRSKLYCLSRNKSRKTNRTTNCPYYYVIFYSLLFTTINQNETVNTATYRTRQVHTIQYITWKEASKEQNITKQIRIMACRTQAEYAVACLRSYLIYANIKQQQKCHTYLRRTTIKQASSVEHSTINKTQYITQLTPT